MRQRQQGVALITAVMIVAIATTVATALLSSQSVTLKRSATLLNHGQAMQYALGAEQWVGTLLRRDREANKTDHLGEEWAADLPPFPIDGGSLHGKLRDLHGCFNLNNLFKDGEVDEISRERLTLMLQELQIDSALVDALLDWMDGDIETRFPGGAEDDRYLGRQPAYRAANAPLADVSELRLITGIDATLYAKLQPHLCALPERTTININTASEPLLRSLHPDVDGVALQELINERAGTPFKDVGSFLAHEAFAGIEVPQEGLGVVSDYFIAEIEVHIAETQVKLASTLVRDDKGKMRIIHRKQGGL